MAFVMLDSARRLGQTLIRLDPRSAPCGIEYQPFSGRTIVCGQYALQPENCFFPRSLRFKKVHFVRGFLGVLTCLVGGSVGGDSTDTAGFGPTSGRASIAA